MVNIKHQYLVFKHITTMFKKIFNQNCSTVKKNLQLMNVLNKYLTQIFSKNSPFDSKMIQNCDYASTSTI